MARPRRRIRTARAALRRTIPAAAALFATLTVARAEPVAVTLPGPGGIALQGRLYRPTGAGPFPAVVALHGCGGLYDRAGALTGRHADWGERLAAQGFLVLFPDSFGSRGLGPQCRISRREIRPGRERVADAEAAGAWLRGRPDVRPDAVSLLGWSNGGSTVLAAVRAGRPTPFARAVAFYPGCRTALERGWRDRTPLLILVGGADDWTGAEPCRALAEEARVRGEPVEITVYPGAVHDFDAPDSAVRERRGLAYTVNRDGVAHTGTDPAARADALARVPAYLAR
ncbi:Dienelactone hydrolase [Methylobacterium sp. 174MFSha1.1]|uniref:dienelactone hydrolase family protein n=1 Tax=Methylobacterium sp. 174MFSha1.1 TaxID=1502749 RepID=UPI0008F08672|nr:dienelactone hydrolase family protein [Methylobacterium sp. 174MFSha1.1]SFU43266.1 Dienelactone hydrolase [Methylobacterium sp. 174MFSha1.1]